MTNEYILHEHENDTNNLYYADRFGKLVKKVPYRNMSQDTNFYDYFASESNEKNKNVQDVIDDWVDFTDDDYSYLNTYTFRNRLNRYTGQYDIPPSEDYVKMAMNGMHEQFLNRSTWYGDLNSRMFSTLEVGAENNRLHLHTLVKNEKTKNKKENWLWNYNSHWSDNFGYYDSRSIDSNTGPVVREYILKANRYIHKDNNAFTSQYFPTFWDWK